jgi:hypothetical protein
MEEPIVLLAMERYRLGHHILGEIERINVRDTVAQSASQKPITTADFQYAIS